MTGRTSQSVPEEVEKYNWPKKDTPDQKKLNRIRQKQNVGDNNKVLGFVVDYQKKNHRTLCHDVIHC